jgi:uncharacterized membrane protein YwzB
MDKDKPSYKETNGTTRVGDFLRKFAPHILDTVGELLPEQGALGIVKNLIDKDTKLTTKQKAEATELLNYDLQNTQGARDLQKEALKQDDLFSKRFIYYLASFWSVTSVLYIFFTTFFKVANAHVLDTILGFLLGTIVATIINYFLGSSNTGK